MDACSLDVIEKPLRKAKRSNHVLLRDQIMYSSLVL